APSAVAGYPEGPLSPPGSGRGPPPDLRGPRPPPPRRRDRDRDRDRDQRDAREPRRAGAGVAPPVGRRRHRRSTAPSPLSAVDGGREPGDPALPAPPEPAGGRGGAAGRFPGGGAASVRGPERLGSERAARASLTLL